MLYLNDQVHECEGMRDYYENVRFVELKVFKNSFFIY